MRVFTIVENANGLLIGKINRPEKRNAINYKVMDGLEQMLDEAERNQSVKVIAITGEGNRSFCSGGDIVEFHHLKTEEQAYDMLSRMGNLLYRLAMVPKPTLAVLNGSALGGGCELAAACDMRIAKSEANLGFIQANLGITTGWGGASLLFERVGMSSGFQLLTGAQVLSAQEMADLGFVDNVFEGTAQDAMDNFMEHTLSKETGVLMGYKKAMIDKLLVSNLKERMEKEIRRCATLWAKDEHHKAVSRFLKR